MSKLSIVFQSLGVAALTVASVAAQQSADRMMPSDSKFITAAAQGGKAEVEMGRLAVQHASDPAVKQFGQRMIDDHTNANEELKQIASRKGITLPDQVNAKQKSTIDRLSRLNGAEFDRAYMEDMVRDHQEDVADFQHEADKGNDSDVKTFAGKTLPTLQDHLKMAQSTNSQLKH